MADEPVEQLLPADLALPAGEPEPIPSDTLEEVAAGRWPEMPSLENDEQCEWAMRRVAGLHRVVRRNRAQRDAWLARINSWYEEQTGGAERLVAYMEGVMERYARSRRERTKRATVKVPSGEVWTRAAADPRLIIDDEDALLAYLVEELDEEAYEACVRISYNVRPGALSGYVTFGEDKDGDPIALYQGEPVPGVHVFAPDMTAGVRPDVKALEDGTIAEALR